MTGPFNVRFITTFILLTIVTFDNLGVLVARILVAVGRLVEVGFGVDEGVGDGERVGVAVSVGSGWVGVEVTFAASVSAFTVNVAITSAAILVSLLLPFGLGRDIVLSWQDINRMKIKLVR